jgi:hypothetical protein
VTRLQEIKERLDGVSPWPWRAESGAPSMDGGNWTFRQEGKPGIIMSAHMYRHGDEDAQFIAHAPEDMALLLEALGDAEKAMALKAEQLRERANELITKVLDDTATKEEANGAIGYDAYASSAEYMLAVFRSSVKGVLEGVKL